MQVLELIARGGFGRVEKVLTSSGAVVARKTFEPAAHASAEALEKLKKRFGREVRTQAALKSSSFLPVLASDLASDFPWFTMPLADRSLHTELENFRNTGDIPQQAFADLLNGLEELHALGMVHRDLKPQNVLLHDGVWKLADFGLVLPVSAETSQLTSTDSAWGTQHYAAPEQVLGFHNVDGAADIYAFGCILHDFFGVDGRVPFSRHSAPGPIGAIIEKCTERDLKRRFKSIHAVRGALLSTLAAAPAMSVGGAAADWAARLSGVATWGEGEVADFARALSRLSNWTDQYAVFSVIDEAALQILLEKNPDAWKFIALEYCSWAEGAFEWSFCDVVIGRLETIFELGDMELKACAAVAAAELGSSHNRWHVMRRLFRMCAPSMEEAQADRLVIEIQAREMHSAFRKCADVEGTSLDVAYHPKLAALLTAA